MAQNCYVHLPRIVEMRQLSLRGTHHLVVFAELIRLTTLIITSC